MNKKPIAILLLLGVAIAAGVGVFMLAGSKRQPDAGGEDVRLYYYRCIPGLKRAEEAGQVLSLRKGYTLDDKGRKVEIDRLWIGGDTAWVLYHTDGGKRLAPSGTLALTGEGGETALYAASGEATESIPADGGLYGYFVLRRTGGDTDMGAVEHASLHPTVTVERWLRPRVMELSPIPIAYSGNPTEESAQDIPLMQETHELGTLGSLTPKQITMAQSRTYLALEWASAYTLYGITGTLASRTGESLPLDGRVEAGRIALPAFNYPDTLYTLSLDRVYVRHPGTLTLTIDPKDYRKRGSRKNIGQPAFAPGGPQCILNRIRVEKDWVYLDMAPVDGGGGSLSADPWDSGEGTAAYCVNGTSGSAEGALASEGDTLAIAIPRAVWSQDLEIWVQVCDPLIATEPGLSIDLRGE